MLERGRFHWMWWCCYVCITAGLVGCGGHQEHHEHVKELTEEVTPSELEQLLAIIDRLPGGKLPTFDSPMSPPTRWALGQEKSIERIAGEKLDQLEERWTPGYVSQTFVRNPRLRWAMASAEMSPENFSALILSVGVALSKSSVPPETDLGNLLKRAREGAQKLNEDRRSMATLASDEQYQIVQQSLWIPLLDLMTHYPMVSDGTLQLVKQHRARLEKAFPPEFTENPLPYYDKILNNSGLPFEDLPETGITDLTAWDPESTARANSGEATENDRYESSDEAFTPPEHLFSSQPEETGGSGVDRAETPAPSGSATAPNGRESAKNPGTGVQQ